MERVCGATYAAVLPWPRAPEFRFLAYLGASSPLRSRPKPRSFHHLIEYLTRFTLNLFDPLDLLAGLLRKKTSAFNKALQVLSDEPAEMHANRQTDPKFHFLSSYSAYRSIPSYGLIIRCRFRNSQMYGPGRLLPTYQAVIPFRKCWVLTGALCPY